MSDYLIKEQTLINIADAIRFKTNSSDKINPEDMDNSISNIITLSDGSSDANATTSDILKGKTAYVNGIKITGNIVTKTSSDLTVSGATVSIPVGYYANAINKSVATTTHPNPTATINASTGVITASHTQTAGFVNAGTTTGTLNLSTQAAKTVTPGTANKTAVAAGKYTTGAVTVAGDADLIATNIKSGVNIFGVAGTYIAPTDTTATAAQILTGQTAYIGGSKVTGTMVNNGAVSKSITPSTSAQSYTIPAGYHNGSGKVTVNAAPVSLINGDANPGQVLSGKTYFSDSYTAKTGTMPNNGAVSQSLNCGGSYTIPAGYHNGSGKVTANTLASQTSATATAADIVSGKTAYVNGNKITGNYVASPNAVHFGATIDNSRSCSIYGLDDNKTYIISAAEYDHSGGFTRNNISTWILKNGIITNVGGAYWSRGSSGAYGREQGVLMSASYNSGQVTVSTSISNTYCAISVMELT